MSPLEARMAVGQPDIVERLHVIKAKCGPTLKCALADEVDISDAAHEIENLRAVLRAVRASTDPEWAARLISYALRETQQ